MRMSSKTPKDYLKELPPVPPSIITVRQHLTHNPCIQPRHHLQEEHHKLLHAELARVAAQQDLNALDATRYRLDKPAEAQRDDPEAWQQAVDNAKSQLQHQHNR